MNIKYNASFSVRFSLIILMALFTLSCNTDDNQTIPSSTDLESYLKNKVDYVHSINGFYIVGSATNPPTRDFVSPAGTTGKDVFDHAIHIFSSLLDQNNDGMVDDNQKQLNTYLKNTMMFYAGPHAESKGELFEDDPFITSQGIYVITMKTDLWPYHAEYNGKGFNVDTLHSSLWRPQNNFNALWEEVFHTITEAISRFDSDFAFHQGAQLRNLMDADIAADTYDITEQNQLEEGNYDRITATNEYVHQIWAIHFSGQSDILNTFQTQALELMISKGVPMRINPNYNTPLGQRIK